LPDAASGDQYGILSWDMLYWSTDLPRPGSQSTQDLRGGRSNRALTRPRADAPAAAWYALFFSQKCCTLCNIFVKRMSYSALPEANFLSGFETA
jgi:hypothetical protein